MPAGVTVRFNWQPATNGFEFTTSDIYQVAKSDPVEHQHASRYLLPRT